jgi:hypothetical protein
LAKDTKDEIKKFKSDIKEDAKNWKDDKENLDKALVHKMFDKGVSKKQIEKALDKSLPK